MGHTKELKHIGNRCGGVWRPLDVRDSSDLSEKDVPVHFFRLGTLLIPHREDDDRDFPWCLHEGPQQKKREREYHIGESTEYRTGTQEPISPQKKSTPITQEPAIARSF
jgi:hypothetical protein